MNSTENRKSMDDVLASIRRIVRAEKEPETADPGRPEPRPAPAAPPAPPAGQGPERPLPLTPDMRMDSGVVEPEAISRPADSALTGAASAVTAPAATAPAAAATAPDREALRQVVREVLRDELSSGAADQAVRNIIRDELINGEIGSNISQNVLRLIQDEVAKALEEG